jgi:hypothetical protein
VQIEPGSSLLESGPTADAAELYGGYQPNPPQPHPFNLSYGPSSPPMPPSDYGTFLQAPSTMAPSWMSQPYTDVASLSLQEQLPNFRAPHLLGPHSPDYAMARYLHDVERGLPQQQAVPAAPTAGLPMAVPRGPPGPTGGATASTGPGMPASSQYASGYQVGMLNRTPSTPEIQQMMQQLALYGAPQPPAEE